MSYRGRVLQVKWPNQQCQSTEGSSSPKDQASIPLGPPHHVTILYSTHACNVQSDSKQHIHKNDSTQNVDVDELKLYLIDSWSSIQHGHLAGDHWSSDWSVASYAEGMHSIQRQTFWTFVAMFWYCTVLSALFATMFYLNVGGNNECSGLHNVTDVGLCTLNFTRHYTDILLEILTSLMLFCCKFIKI